MIISQTVWGQDDASTAEKPQTAAQYDVDGDGLSPDEYRKALDARLEYLQGKEKKQADKTHQFEQRIEQDLMPEYESRPDGRWMSASDFDRRYWSDLPASDDWFDHLETLPVWQDLYLRRSIDEIDIRTLAIGNEDRKKSFKDAEGAIFGFAHDPDSGDGTLKARGIVAAPKFWTDRDNGPSEILFAPSLAFDRFDSDANPDKEVNELISRISGQFRFATPPEASEADKVNIDAHLVKVGLAYITDFDFDVSQAALELEYSPVITAIGNGTSQYFPSYEDGIIEWRLSQSIYLQHGDTFATGGDGDLEQGSFTRIGPKVRLELWPVDPALSRLKFVAEYRYLDGLDGPLGHASLIDLRIKYQLDEAKRYALELYYREGDTLFTDKPIDELGIGLTIKY